MLAAGDLVENPRVGFLQPVAQWYFRLPTQHVADQCVLAVASVDPFRCVQIVTAGELHARDILDDINQLVDRYLLFTAEIDGEGDLLTPHDGLQAMQAIVHIHETAGLVAAAPDLDLLRAARLRLDYLAADGGGRLLASAVEGPVGTVHVVEASDTGDQAKVLREVPAHAFAE